MPLIEGSDVLVDDKLLSEIKMKYSGNSREMTRQLMKLIIGRETLKHMTPTGGYGKDRIPLEVVEAVFRKLQLLFR